MRERGVMVHDMIAHISDSKDKPNVVFVPLVDGAQSDSSIDGSEHDSSMSDGVPDSPVEQKVVVDLPPEIKIPPFLLWPTREEEKERDGQFSDLTSDDAWIQMQTKAEFAKRETMRLQYLLNRMDRHLRSARRRKSRNVSSKYVSAARVSKSEVATAVFPRPDDDTGSPKSSSKQRDEDNPPSPAPTPKTWILVDDKMQIAMSDLPAIEHVINYTNKARMEYLRGELFRLAQKVIALFVPEDCQHEIVQAYWGSIWTIVVGCNEYHMYEARHPPGSRRNVWIVEEHELASGTVAYDYRLHDRIEGCDTCKARTAYPSADDAVKHIQEVHIGDILRAGRLTNARLDESLKTLWVCNIEDRRRRIWEDDDLDMLELCTRYLSRVETRGREICDGIAKDRKSKSSLYMLPPGLVDALEECLYFLLLAGWAREKAREDLESWPRSESNPEPYDRSEDTHLLYRYLDLDEGSLDIHMKEAQQDLILMVRARNLSKTPTTTSYATIGPEYLLATFLNKLQSRPVHTSKDVVALYTEFTMKIV